MNRCLHCGEPVRDLVCADYPECIVLKGMYPLDSVSNSGAELRAGEGSQPLQKNQSAVLPPDSRPTGEGVS